MNKLFLSVLSAAFMTAPAYAQEAAADLLVPTNAWMVGPATLAEGMAETGGVPCVMVNKFSNNVEMRLSGGGEKILAMALSVEGQPFTKDQSYLMDIGFADGAGNPFPAQAFTENTLVVGLEPEKDFYKSLQTENSLFVTLGTEKMEFSLLGVPQGLKRMESCFQPAVRAAAPQAETKSEPAVTGIHKLNEPRLDDAEAKHASALIDDATASGNALPPWDVEQRAPEEEPEEIVPEEQVVEEVTAETPAAKEPPPPAEQPVISRAEPDVGAVRAPSTVAKPRDILPATTDNQEKRWRVMKGGELQSLLKVWADSTNTRLIWMADQPFSAPESMAMQGSFEEAVQTILSQYPMDKSRPVGKIYNDPTSRQRVLLIEVENPPATPVSEGNYAPIDAR